MAEPLTMGNKKRDIHSVSSSPSKNVLNQDQTRQKSTKSRKFGHHGTKMPINNLLGTFAHRNNSSNTEEANQIRNHGVLKSTSYNVLVNKPKIRHPNNDSITLLKTRNGKNVQSDQIFWSGNRGNSVLLGGTSPDRAFKSQQTSFNNENVDIRPNTEQPNTEQPNTLPNLKVDPISLLEKKYKTNFALASQTPRLKSAVLSSNNKIKLSNSYTGTPQEKSPIFKKSKSLSLSSSKLFSKITNDGINNSTSLNKKNSLKEILSELKNNENEFENGNTTSEILDRGISINDYQREDFGDDFFDESFTASVKDPMKTTAVLENKIARITEETTSTPTTDRTINQSLDNEFDDEFSSDDDVFDELQKKIDQKGQFIAVESETNTSTVSKLPHSTPKAVPIKGMDNLLISENNHKAGKSNGNTSMNEDSDFSIDEEEENVLLDKLSQKKFSTQQLSKIKHVDSVGAAVFSKDIKGDSNLDETKFKDVFSEINMAKIAVQRSWLHRFVILETREKTYNLKGVKKSQIILKVKDNESKVRNIVVRESWLLTHYDVGEIIHIIGEVPTVVDNDHNYLILNPDTLISATSLGESLNCERKSALLARYNLPGESSKPLIVGHIVHMVLQKCMATKRNDDKFIDEILLDFINSFLIDILSINETEQSIDNECRNHIDYIKDWIDKFVFDSENSSSSIKTFGQKEETVFSVSKILDIEESIWSPIFGIRGLLDATIEASLKNANQKGKFVAPLEIKTGKDYLSHKAQTSLYTLLMKDRYEMDVNFFILLYTKMRQTTKYEIDRRDLRMLLIKRNSLSKFLKTIQFEIPPVIKNSFCDRCFVKDVCMTYNKLIEDGSEEESGFKAGEFTEATKHIEPEFSNYYRYWEDLINKEENFITKLNKELWIFTAEEREEQNGKALCNLRIKDVTFDSTSQYYTYVFERNSEKQFSPMTWSQISKHDSVLVSDEKGHFALCSGFIVVVEPGFVKLNTKRRLEHSFVKLPNFDSHKNQIFQSVLLNLDTLPTTRAEDNDLTQRSKRSYRIDKNPAFHGLQVARYNLLELFIKGGSETLRNILVKKQRKTDSNASLFNYKIDDKKFNIDQRAAIDKCFTTNDFALILGMPGTGKTTTITAIIECLIKNGKSVLVASYTHSAIDNILIKLKDQNITDFVRLGSTSKIHPSLKKFSPYSPECIITNRDELFDVYVKPSIVATTCLGINDWIFNHRKFDYCIIDEASQVSMPICLGPLRFCEKFILVGDHYQLPPLVVAPDAKKGLQKSLFKLLSEDFPESVVELSHQYRMCEDIMMLSNTLIYNGRLKCGSAEVAKKVLKIPFPERIQANMASNVTNPEDYWMNIIFKEENKVIFLNHDPVGAKERLLGDKIDNPTEAELIYQIVEGLLAGGVAESSIGVMSLYRAQIKLLNIKLHSRRGVEVLTADKFQGLDKDCVIISLVRANDKQATGELLREWRRINVAITRAKSKLIIIGSRKTLRSLATLNAFMNVIESRGWLYDLPRNALSCYEFFFQALSNQSSPAKSNVKQRTKISQKLLDKHLLLKNIVDESK